MEWNSSDKCHRCRKRVSGMMSVCHDDVIKWKHFPRNWPFVRGIHRSPVNSPHKGQWRGALMFSLIYVWINDWVNNREAGDLRRYRVQYDVIVMISTYDIYKHYTLWLSFSAIRCKWNGQPCSYQYLTATMNKMGRCYTFNPGDNGDVLTVEQQGRNTENVGSWNLVCMPYSN